MLIKFNSSVRILRAIMSCTIVGLLLQSCDERYNLDNIGGDVHLFENGLSAPIGSTEKFYLGDFVEENEMLVVEDGKYVLQYSGQVSSEAIEVPSFSIDEINPTLTTTHLDFVESLNEVPELSAIIESLGYTGGPLPSIPGLVAPDAHATIAEKIEYFDYTIEGIPAEVINIQSITPGENTLITLSLHAEGFPKTITHLTFEFILTPPAQMKIVPVEQDIWCDVDGKFHIEHDLPCIDGKLDDEVHFRLDALEFNPPVERSDKGTISIESELHYEGKVHINEPFDLGGWTPAIDLNVHFVSAPTTVNSFAACMQASIEPLAIQQSLSGMPEILNNPNICLDLQSVNLTFDINNKTPLAFESTFEMQSTFNDGSVSPLITIDEPLHVEANTLQTLVLTNDEAYVGTPGYVSGLNELVKRVPRDFSLTAVPSIPPTDIEMTIGDEYSVEVDYKMSLPILFGDEVNLELEAQIDGLNGNGELLTIAREVILYADIESTLPLDLTMEAVAYDINGNVMNNVRIEGLPVVRAKAITPMELNISVVGEKETLDKFDKILLTIKGTSENGGELAPTQYLQFNKIALNLPNGVGIEDINNL